MAHHENGMLDHTPKLLAISSGGGHWVQLLRLRPAFAGCEVTYATVREGYRTDVIGEDFKLIHDGNRSNVLNLIRSAVGIVLLLLRTRPDIVITTGAAPGFFGCMFGRYLGARVIWIDSIANAERLSASGKNVRIFAHLWLTQWSHLESESGPKYLGNVL